MWSAPLYKTDKETKKTFSNAQAQKELWSWTNCSSVNHKKIFLGQYAKVVHHLEK